jgi:glycosyltransferase involved in cell wall biosynthesis
MTKLPDLAEVVKEEGLMVEFTTLKDLKRTIEKLLSNLRLQRKIVKNNLKAARNLSFRVVAKEFVNLYKEVLKG